MTKTTRSRDHDGYWEFIGIIRFHIIDSLHLVLIKAERASRENSVLIRHVLKSTSDADATPTGSNC